MFKLTEKKGDIMNHWCLQIVSIQYIEKNTSLQYNLHLHFIFLFTFLIMHISFQISLMY